MPAVYLGGRIFCVSHLGAPPKFWWESGRRPRAGTRRIKKKEWSVGLLSNKLTTECLHRQRRHNYLLLSTATERARSAATAEIARDA